MSDKENKELSKIISINKDACEFYNSAQQQAKSHEAKVIFKNLENLHSGVIVNLQTLARAQGADAEAEETFAGQVRQFWGNLMSKVSNDVDETLVSQLEEAEDRCLNSIKDIMDDSDISASTKAALSSEYQTLRKSHDYMKSLKEQIKAA